jgi:two-component system chemotaxis response regulator CheY
MEKIALVVDDSKTMREMVSFTLRKAGFDIIEAEDGKLALDAIANKKVNVIVTDLNMPNMNGLQLIKALRSTSAYAMTPILMLTTEGDGFKKLEGKNAGATGWLVKPFDPMRLIQIINKVCP